MRVDGRVRIAGAHAEIPETRQPVELAVHTGTVTPEQAAASGVDSLPTAGPGVSAVSMAVQAARTALAECGIAARDIALLIHAWMVDSDQDWKIAPRLARLLGAPDAVAFGIRQMCNGGAMGVQLAIAQLLADSRLRHALVLTADALGPDSLRRWQLGASGAPLGDAATALVLSTTRGTLSVRAVTTRSHSEQEAVFAEHNPVLRGPSPAEAEDTGVFSGKLAIRLRGRVRAAVLEACADAGLAPKDPRLTTVLLPRVDPVVTRVLTDGVLPLAAGTQLVHLTAETGHLFAGDLAANVVHLREKCRLEPGQYALALNIGGGFTTTCLVVRAENEE